MKITGTIVALCVLAATALAADQEVPREREDVREAIHAARTLEDKDAAPKVFDPGASYIWTFGILPDGGTPATVATGPTLELGSPAPTDSGWYQVRVEEPGQNPVLSDPVQLIVGQDTALPLWSGRNFCVLLAVFLVVGANAARRVA